MASRVVSRMTFASTASGSRIGDGVAGWQRTLTNPATLIAASAAVPTPGFPPEERSLPRKTPATASHGAVVVLEEAGRRFAVGVWKTTRPP